MDPRNRDDYFPTRGDLEGNWIKLRLLVETCVASSARPAYLSMMTALKSDVVQGDKVLLGFVRAPAARNNHHSFEGGLVYHLLEMWDNWNLLREASIGRFFRAPDEMQTTLPEACPTDDLVLRAIINHDINKAHQLYCLNNPDPWTVTFAESLDEKLMGETLHSFSVLTSNQIPMEPVMVNALALAHGGFSDVKPPWTSVLAKLVYLLDEFSGNVRNRIEVGKLLDHKQGG